MLDLGRLLDRLRRGSPPDDGPARLALALTGGGARAAYQVGVVRGLTKRFPAFRPNVLTGVSAGAVNAAYLAAYAADVPRAADGLADVWRGLTADRVFRLDRPGVMSTIARTVRPPSTIDPPAEGGLLDTTPLRDFLASLLGPVGQPMPGVAAALAEGHLDAFALTTTSYTTGQSVTWVQREPEAGRTEAESRVESWDRPMRRAIRTPLRTEHVLASAALPFFFPSVEIRDARLGHGWYGDGGIRLTAPLSPALHLGADKLLVVSTRHPPTRSEADAPKLRDYPPPTRILGVLLNSVFLDVVDRDADVLRRVNALLATTPREDWNGFRPVDLLVIRPSQDLGKLAEGIEPRLPPSMRIVTGGLSSGDGASEDWLSMLLFEPTYVERLLALGEADAERHADDLTAFLEGDLAAR